MFFVFTKNITLYFVAANLLFACIFILLVNHVIYAMNEYADYFEKIEAWYKDKKDLKMVLGAGDSEENFTRLKEYTFLVTNTISDYVNKKISACSEKLIEPLVIPLDFNHEDFWKWLAKFNGQFKEIIFDRSVVKFVSWKKDNVKKIYDALQEDGEFYMEAYFMLGTGIQLVEIGDIKSWNPYYLEKRNDKLYARYDPMPREGYKGHSKFLLPHVIFAIRDIEPGEGMYHHDQRKNPFNSQEKAVCGPRPEVAEKWVIDGLKNAGFEYVVRKRNAPYPLHAPWDGFHEFDYIYAKKKITYTIHFAKIKEKYKDRKDLKMVLGAGDNPEDYTERFQEYTFLVTNNPLQEKVCIDKDEKIDQEPIVIPLDFNKQNFWSWLKDFNEQFKEIIFDHSVLKFVAWNGGKNPGPLWLLYAALQDDGEFYMEAYAEATGAARVITNYSQASQSILTPYYIQAKDGTQYAYYDPFTDWGVEKLVLPHVMFRIQDLRPGEGTYQKEPGVIYGPTLELSNKWQIATLKKIGLEYGFEYVEYKEKKPYPLYKAWKSWHGIDFSQYDYIYAKKIKPHTLLNQLDKLREHLLIFQSRLENLQKALNQLKSELKKPFDD